MADDLCFADLSSTISSAQHANIDALASKGVR